MTDPAILLFTVYLLGLITGGGVAFCLLPR